MDQDADDDQAASKDDRQGRQDLWPLRGGNAKAIAHPLNRRCWCCCLKRSVVVVAAAATVVVVVVRPAVVIDVHAPSSGHLKAPKKNAQFGYILHWRIFLPGTHLLHTCTVECVLPPSPLKKIRQSSINLVSIVLEKACTDPRVVGQVLLNRASRCDSPVVARASLTGRARRRFPLGESFESANNISGGDLRREASSWRTWRPRRTRRH